MDYQALFRAAVKRIKSERRHRVFADLARRAGDFPRARNGTEAALPFTSGYVANAAALAAVWRRLDHRQAA